MKKDDLFKLSKAEKWKWMVINFFHWQCYVIGSEGTSKETFQVKWQGSGLIVNHESGKNAPKQHLKCVLDKYVVGKVTNLIISSLCILLDAKLIEF